MRYTAPFFACTTICQLPFSDSTLTFSANVPRSCAHCTGPFASSFVTNISILPPPFATTKSSGRLRPAGHTEVGIASRSAFLQKDKRRSWLQIPAPAEADAGNTPSTVMWTSAATHSSVPRSDSANASAWIVINHHKTLNRFEELEDMRVRLNVYSCRSESSYIHIKVHLRTHPLSKLTCTHPNRRQGRDFAFTGEDPDAAESV